MYRCRSLPPERPGHPVTPPLVGLVPGGLLLGDFELRGRRIYLCKTGNSAAIGWDLLAEVAIWLVFHLIVRAKAR